MMATASTMRARTTRVTPRPHLSGSAPPVYVAPAVRGDRIRFRAGAAYLALDGTSEELGLLFGRDDSLIRQWRRGLPSPASRFYAQIDELERSGRDASALIEGAKTVRVQARIETLPTHELTAELLELHAEEEAATHATNLAQHHVLRCPSRETLAGLAEAACRQASVSRRIAAKAHLLAGRI